MSLTDADIKKIAKLSRLKLDDEEIAHFKQELSGILKWVEQLQAIDTDNVALMTSNTSFPLPMREDVVTDGNYAEEVLKNAPRSEYGCFIVPKVVE